MKTVARIAIRSVAGLGLVALATLAMAQDWREVSGSGPTREIALATLRGNAISACIRQSTPGGFDHVELTCRETGSVPPWVCRAQYQCNGAAPVRRDEWISRAAPQ